MSATSRLPLSFSPHATPANRKPGTWIGTRLTATRTAPPPFDRARLGAVAFLVLLAATAGTGVVASDFRRVAARAARLGLRRSRGRLASATHGHLCRLRT